MIRKMLSVMLYLLSAGTVFLGMFVSTEYSQFATFLFCGGVLAFIGMVVDSTFDVKGS